MGRVRSGNLHFVACTLEEINDSSTTAKIATGIEANISILDTVIKTILQKPLVEVVDQQGLGAKRSTPELLAVVIFDQNITSFAVQTHQSFAAIPVFRRGLDHEPHIDQDPLVALRSSTRGSLTMSGLTELSMSTDRTCIKFSPKRNFGDAVGSLVHLGNATRMNVTKTLVPE